MKRELILNTIKFLEKRANETDNGWEWREACGLIKELTEAFSITNEEYNKIVEDLRDARFNNKILNPCCEIPLDKAQPTINFDENLL